MNQTSNPIRRARRKASLWKRLLSNFQITPKSVLAYVALFAAYVQDLGHLPQTRRQWGVTIFGFVLSTLVPARDPNANKDPADTQG